MNDIVQFMEIYGYTVAAGVVVLAFAQASCGQRASYPLRLYELNQRQMLEKATLIVVGTAADAQWEPARMPIEWSIQPGVSSVRLLKVRLNIEQVIRGTVNGNQITVYYWGADVFTNASSLHLPVAGERAVHYLVHEQGVFRYVRDLVRSNTIVLSGVHTKAPGSRDGGAERDIVRILLTPGEEMSVKQFTGNLPATVADSLQLAGFTGTLPLLLKLSKNPAWEVKWSACIQLYKSGFKGQDRCINEIASEAREHMRESELRTLQTRRANADSDFRRAFLANPVRTAKDYALLPGNAGIVDFLCVITQHPDKELAVRAQKELETAALRAIAP